MPTLQHLFPDPKDLLALAPEDLAAVLVSFAQERYKNNAGFLLEDFLYQLFPAGGGGYPDGPKMDVTLALAEALSWLISVGLAVRDPRNPGVPRFLLTRRGRTLKSSAEVEVFRKGRALPVELLQPGFAERVRPLFVRGDYDTAVFQAFKEVEVAVRKAGNYPDTLYGRELMAVAFGEGGVLRSGSPVPSERQAEQQLFMGAVGHAKNPLSHREVRHNLESAGRLIIFASYLLEIVESRNLVADLALRPANPA